MGGAGVGHLVGQRVDEDVEEAEQLLGDAGYARGLVAREEPFPSHTNIHALAR